MNSFKFYEIQWDSMKIYEKQWFRGTEERVSGGRAECLSVSEEGLWELKKRLSGG